MAYTTINKSTDHFNIVQWTGNASTNAITGVNFRPDWVWGKSHTGGYSHQLYDVVRGATYSLKTNGNTAQETLSTGLTSFDSDGFTLGSNTNINASGHTVTGWCWKAGNSAGSTNSDGSVTSTVSANTTAGFSIVKFDPTGAACTIGHGLGVAPKVIIAKAFNRTFSWVWGGDAIGWTKYLEINSTQDVQTSTARWNDTAPTSTVFSVKNEYNSGDNAIAYCFAEKTGFSKFGSYTGNGNVNGSFIYTGFKPNFILIKRTDASENWVIEDGKQRSYNPSYAFFLADVNTIPTYGTGDGNQKIDLLSNGFKIRTTSVYSNASGGNYIFMAFAKAPLVGSNNVPATAR